MRWSDALFGYRIGSEDLAELPDKRDSAPDVPKSVVVNPAFVWGRDTQLRTPWGRTLIYEVHVKGFTQQHPDVPEELRGTYAGLASFPAIDYLQRLGVTAVELLPVHHHVDDRRLVERGLTNYWGYNTIGFFAPDARYSATGEPVSEFKSMVKRLHDAGIEVILDVVYNHTGEGQPPRPDAQLPRHRQRRLLPPRSRRTGATTSTTPAPATRSTRPIRVSCS